MPDQAVLGHLCIGDFSQQLRLEPMHAAGIGALGWVDHGRVLDLQRLELLEDARQGASIETSADLAGIAQLTAVGVMQPEQQGAEGTARTFRIAVADHDELLAQLALELDPVGAAA
ncbi:hypothetical protein D9M71_302670 [compost metagenome]